MLWMRRISIRICTRRLGVEIGQRFVEALDPGLLMIALASAIVVLTPKLSGRRSFEAV